MLALLRLCTPACDFGRIDDSDGQPAAQAPSMPLLSLMGADGATLEPCENKPEGKGKRQALPGQVEKAREGGDRASERARERAGL